MKTIGINIQIMSMILCIFKKSLLIIRFKSQNRIDTKRIIYC